jgi:hypothetical protein
VGLRFIEVGRFAGPSLVGEAGEVLDLFLAGDIEPLFLDGGRVRPYVAQPLMPLGCSC